MKSSSHGRYTSAISNSFRSTINLILIVTLAIPAALTFAKTGASIAQVLSDRTAVPPTGTLPAKEQAPPADKVAPAPAAFQGSDPVPQPLPYAQDFSLLAHSSTVYPQGWQGWQIGTGGSAGSGTIFKTIEPSADVALSANSSASSTGGTIHNYNGKLGSLSTGSVDPAVALAIDTTGFTGVNIAFDAMTIRNPYNGTTNTRINELDLQYRACSLTPCSGAFASASESAGIYQNNTTAQTSGTNPQNLVTIVIALPAAVNHQANVQLRWVQRDVSGTGSRPSFAIDNVLITGASGCTGPVVTLDPVNDSVTYGAPSISFASAASGDPMPSVHWQVNTGGGFVPLPNGGDVSGADTTTLTIAKPTVALSGNAYRAVFSNECGGTQTAASTAATLTVDPLAISVSPDAGQSKTYGNADPPLSYSFSPPLIRWDEFSGELGRVAGENVGFYGITQGSLDLGANYTINLAGGISFQITPRTALPSITADDKVYDGGTHATFICSLEGIVEPDDVSCVGGDATFAVANVGLHLVTASGLSLAGMDAGNYSIPVSSAIDTAEIVVRPITVTAVSDAKIYDGTIASPGTPIVMSGSIVRTDVADFVQWFDTKHAASGKTLTPVGSVIDGNGGANYAITFVSDVSGVITQKPVTVTAVAATKPYDGNVSSSGVPNVFPELVGGDSPNFIQTYDTPDPGTNKTLTPSGVADDGNAGANYIYTFVAVNSGIITAAGTYCFEGFHGPIGGSVEGGNGGSPSDPVRAFKLNSTIPIKFTLLPAGCVGEPIGTGIHTLHMIRYSDDVDSDSAIDATPIGVETTGNQFRYTGTEWHYNLNTRKSPGISAGTWLVKALLSDGSVRTVWISIKK